MRGCRGLPASVCAVGLRQVDGIGGKKVVLDDPSGNPVELFEPTRAEARLTHR